MFLKLENSHYEDFRYMKIHIFALRWRDEIKGSSQLRTLLKRVVVSRTCTGLNFFQVLLTTTRFSSVLSCEDPLILTLIMLCAVQ